MKYRMVAVLSILFLLLTALATQATADPRKILVVVFENTNYKGALSQPFFSKFAKEGVLLTNYHAVTHPSQANYIALVGGGDLGVRGDGRYDLNATHLGDLLEAKGRTWRVYAEGYPGKCSTTMHQGAYYRKHNPLISFTNIQNNPARCANIEDATNFSSDFQSGKLADFSMYIPDIKNDGHDTGVAFADRWFAKTFGPLIQNKIAMAGVLIVATFDENEGSSGNQVFAALYGPEVNAGMQVATKYDHLSLLRTIEEIFRLGTLGRDDAKASPIVGYLR